MDERAGEKEDEAAQRREWRVPTPSRFHRPPCSWI